MDVLARPEGGDHLFILGHVGQQAQLDLGIVRVHQHPAGAGDEHGSHLGAQRGADGDVLQVRLGGRQPPGGGDRVLEAGVDAPVRGNDLFQPLHIGGVELGQLAVFQDLVDDGVLVPQLFQHLGAGGVAGLGLFHRRQAQVLKEDLAQLLGGV